MQCSIHVLKKLRNQLLNVSGPKVLRIQGSLISWDLVQYVVAYSNGSAINSNSTLGYGIEGLVGVTAVSFSFFR